VCGRPVDLKGSEEHVMGVADDLRQRVPGPTGETRLEAPRKNVGRALASSLQRILRSARVHWALLLVLGLFGASTLIVPTLAPVAVSDDFLYARSVDILLSDGELVILPATAATLVFQVGWGAIFAGVFGYSFGVLRAGTSVFTLISSLAVYGLCRELGVDKLRSALGAAIFLFSPLGYLFSFTFMTDSYLVGLVTVSAYFYVRGLAKDQFRDGWIVAGSVVAALAFLVRHQGLLVPIAVVTYLGVSGRLRRDAASLRLLVRVLLVPAVAAAGFFVWFRLIHGVPEHSAQTNYFDAWFDAGVLDIVKLTRSIFVFSLIFIGLFVLPLGLGALPRVPAMIRATPQRGWLVFGAAVVAAGIAAVSFAAPDGQLRIPLVPGSLTEVGLGPSGDLRGGRLPVVGTQALGLATVACATATIVVLLAVCARLRRPKNADDGAAWVVLSVLAWQAIGVLGPSMILRDTVLSFDRYFLPLLPLAICLALWALRDVKLNVPIAVLVTAGLAVFSVAGTRDFLTYQSTTWQVARDAHKAGVPYDRLDAGAAWDGDQLYEHPERNRPTLEAPRDVNAAFVPLSAHDADPGWIVFYAPGIREHYVVSAEPLQGYAVVRRVEYSSWLQDDPTYIYLLRRADVNPGDEGP
jgi:4-amino-4-deoxy-L-arabinose transferase-like glycosyltransferase